MTTAPHFLSRGLGLRPDQLSIMVHGPDLQLASFVELAVDSGTRKRGLLGRDRLDAGHALVIAPSSGVHTFGMAFPIDIIFVSRTGVVLKVRHTVARSRIAVSLRAFAVIEMAAGSAEAHDVRRGTQLSLVVRGG